VSTESNGALGESGRGGRGGPHNFQEGARPGWSGRHRHNRSTPRVVGAVRSATQVKGPGPQVRGVGRRGAVMVVAGWEAPKVTPKSRKGARGSEVGVGRRGGSVRSVNETRKGWRLGALFVYPNKERPWWLEVGSWRVITARATLAAAASAATPLLWTSSSREPNRSRLRKTTR